MQRGIDQGKLLNKRISSKFSLVFDCVGHLVSDVAENKLVWEMSELITEIAGLICPVISEEDSDHGVRLDADWSTSMSRTVPAVLFHKEPAWASIAPY